MRQFIIRRIIYSVFILFCVSIVLYTIIRLMPGDYISTVTSQNPNISTDMVDRLKHLYGLDTNIITGYSRWLMSALQGNLGDSFVFQKPVTEVIGDRMWVSFSLSASALFFEMLIGIPLGIYAATHQYKKGDYVTTAVALIGISLPSFFFAAILQRVFSMWLGIFPLQGMITARKRLEGFDLFLDMAWHFCLPIILFTVMGIGDWMRRTRTNMLEVLNADYIRTARAKGLSEHKVIYKHAFRNTLIPIVTMLGLVIPGLFSGAIITEGIFAIDGIGRTAYNAMLKGDIPFMMGFNMFLAVLTVAGTLLADLLYAAVDPRVRLS